MKRESRSTRRNQKLFLSFLSVSFFFSFLSLSLSLSLSLALYQNVGRLTLGVDAEDLARRDVRGAAGGGDGEGEWGRSGRRGRRHCRTSSSSCASRSERRQRRRKEGVQRWLLLLRRRSRSGEATAFASGLHSEEREKKKEEKVIGLFFKQSCSFLFHLFFYRSQEETSKNRHAHTHARRKHTLEKRPQQTR